ncbi:MULTISPECIES: M13 family metallopeptidase [unclassified Mycoplasma]|uniref:M13 family metallopeptidase n=1 Tax=unclassified Mycoplasma TaxID=2683645 RepID=UPI00211CAB24|nr:MULTISPECIES: M13 family metallopeptidase [unclassified Mycoplasma]UUM19504.1 M13 family metallopeptidase [Mycoplasma sp. 1578d]UUM25127.1 M13 family metallopeptidase [Mycoplasma sp. 3686d]
MKKPNLKDDFYQYTNYSWLKKAKIDPDKPSISAFGELDKKLNKQLISLADQLASNSDQLTGPLSEFAKFYKMFKNYKKRNALAMKPAKKLISEIEQLSSFDELAQKLISKRSQWEYLPISLEVEDDFVDSSIKVLWLGEQSIILPAKEYYEKEDAQKHLNVFKSMSVKLLQEYGYTQSQANKLADQAVEFDNLVKDYILSSLQKADYTSLYNMTPLDQLKDTSNYFNLEALAKQIVGTNISSIVVTNKDYVANLNKIYNADTFNGYKAMLIIKNLIASCAYLSDELRIIATELRKSVTGIDRAINNKKYAFKSSEQWFNKPFGLAYAQKYFGPQAKKDVKKMIKKMINIYKNRLAQNDWLSQKTKQKAILKLSKLDVMVGYPDKIRPYYKKLKVKTYSQGSNLLENVLNFKAIMQKYQDSLYLKSESKEYWEMSPALINAYFHPIKNHIVFPAAILQAPFYSIEQSSSKNYGGIGAVIAHEISHAFDNNGSQFDENGSLNNWWTDDDRAKFDLRKEQVIELFEGFDTGMGLVNGKLTVSENIADLGGFDCALEAAQGQKEFNAHDFFTNWATIWRIKTKPEYMTLLLKTDVHAPGYARANVHLKNCDLFYETYQITAKNQMFIPQNKRVKIW